MHSRIFQVSMEPIKETDYICEADYYDHWFTREWADYVSNDYNRDNAIKWLKECAKGYTVGKDDNGEYFIITNKEEYFKDAYDMFIDALDKIGRPTLEEFTNGIDLYPLRNAYEDKCGFYIDADGELMTFDSFVRRCVINEKYYIGNALDYHF